MTELFSFDDLLSEAGLKEEAKAVVKATPSRLGGETPTTAFIKAVRTQLVAVEEMEKICKITEKADPHGNTFLDITNIEKLMHVGKGKATNWFCTKKNTQGIVVSCYYGNATLFPSIALKSWASVKKFYNEVIDAAAKGKLQPNFDAIEKSRAESRVATRAAKAAEAAKAAGHNVDASTGEIT